MNLQLNEQNMNHERYAWAVWVNTDLTEGRGHEYVLGFYECKTTALRFAKGRNVMGSDGRVQRERLVQMYGHLYAPGALICPPSKEDLELEKKIRAKEKAVLKALELGMTAEELNILMYGSASTEE